MTSSIYIRPAGSRRLAGLAAGLLVVFVGSMLTAPWAAGRGVTSAANSAKQPAFTKTEHLVREHLVGGAEQVVDRRTFSLSVDNRTELRNRDEVNVSWSGAHPTGGLIADPNSVEAPDQEYPVLLTMCRGTASSVTRESCFTQTPQERFQSDTTTEFPPYRVDQFADAPDRAEKVGLPPKVPSDCPESTTSGVQHWVPFKSVKGHVYYGGFQGCAGVPPEETNNENSLQPGNTTFAASDGKGNGSAKFVITTDETNASLGCNQKVKCSLVIVPIMGISCDAAGRKVPPSDRPSDSDAVEAAYKACSNTGNFQPGISAGAPGEGALAVTGNLWWAASNWRNRIVVPLTFAEPGNVCDITNTSTPTAVYGSQLLLQATQQWSPYFCLNPKLFRLQHVQTSEPEAKNLLADNSISAAFQGNAPPGGFTNPVVQAPTALTGFAIVYAIDVAHGTDHHPYTQLRLDPRLLAKLLTESYPSNTAVANSDAALQNPKTHKPNPIDLAEDPEFQALNPGILTGSISPEPASMILTLSSDSDLTHALTSYINADPAARHWLDGKPDPWGMVVNPAYKGIALPVDNFPLRDTYIPKDIENGNSNSCLASDPLPWLPLVAAPTSDLNNITLDMQFDIAASQINCQNPDAVNKKLVSVGREAPGTRFLLGVTSLGDARRYQLPTAALESHSSANSDKQFTTAAGRTFVSPDDSGLRNAARLLSPDIKTGTFPMNYTALRTSTAGAAAYPGTVLLSTDVPVKGLPKSAAKNYATFLNFVSERGQRPGLGNGDLPVGFLPMTAANGMDREVAYTKAAASAVAAQDGKVPSVLHPGSASQGAPASTGSKGSTGGSEGGPAGSAGGTSSSTSSTSASGGGSDEKGGALPTPGTTTVAARYGHTPAASSRAANVLPIVLVISLGCLVGISVTGLLRPRRP